MEINLTPPNQNEPITDNRSFSTTRLHRFFVSLTDSITQKLGIGDSPTFEDLTLSGVHKTLERTTAEDSEGGYGQSWVKNEDPNERWFTDDTGTDILLSNGLLISLGVAAVQDVGGANGTVHYINWGSEIKKDSGFTHSTTVNPSRIQVDKTGRYSFYFMIGAENTGAGRVALMSSYRINGSTVITNGRQRSNSSGGAYSGVSFGISTEIDLIAGQYVQAAIAVENTDATYVVNTVNNECELIIKRIG